MPDPEPPNSGPPQPEAPETRDGIYRAVLMVMTASVVGGALLALFGDYYFHSEAMKTVGVGVVIVSGAIYFFFRFLGRQAAKRSNAAAGRDDDSRPM